MNRGWIAIGMIGALGLGFGLGRMDLEPPREIKKSPDLVTPQELDVRETDEVLEFSNLSKGEAFVLGYGEPPGRWRPVPPGPGSVKVPREDLGEVWGVLGVRAKPCHCTPVDPPPGWLQGFLDQTSRVADFCDRCDSQRSQCQDGAIGELGERCKVCQLVCWGG